MRRFIQIFVFAGLVLSSITSNAQTSEKEVAIEHLVDALRNCLADENGPMMYATVSRLKQSNTNVADGKWKEFAAEVNGILKSELLKAGTAGYIKVKARLQTLSLEDIQTVETQLRSPAYLRYQAALADDSTSEATVMTMMRVMEQISSTAQKYGIKVN